MDFFPMDFIRCIVSHNRMGYANLLNERHQSIWANQTLALHWVEVIASLTISEHLRHQVPLIDCVFEIIVPEYPRPLKLGKAR